MWIFLAKIHADITTPVYTIWENAIAAKTKTRREWGTQYLWAGSILRQCFA